MDKLILDFMLPIPDFPFNRRSWFRLEFLEVYLVAGYILFIDATVSAIIVPNISLHLMEDKGKHHFKNFIIDLESAAQRAGYEVVKIENASQELTSMLMKNGYEYSNPEQKNYCFGYNVAKKLQY